LLLNLTTITNGKILDFVIALAPRKDWQFFYTD